MNHSIAQIPYNIQKRFKIGRDQRKVSVLPRYPSYKVPVKRELTVHFYTVQAL